MKTPLRLMAPVTNNSINEQKERRCPQCDKKAIIVSVIADHVDMTFAEQELHTLYSSFYPIVSVANRNPVYRRDIWLIL
jgi:predicted  nucleic acid-binding Zn ribbon protein